MQRQKLDHVVLTVLFLLVAGQFVGCGRRGGSDGPTSAADAPATAGGQRDEGQGGPASESGRTKETLATTPSAPTAAAAPPLSQPENVVAESAAAKDVAGLADSISSKLGQVAPRETTESTAGEMVTVQDIPITKDAKKVEFDPKESEIRYTSPTDVKTLVDFYREKMDSLGWKEDKLLSVVVQDTGVLELAKGQASVSIVILNAGPKEGRQVTIGCRGILWEAPEPPAAPSRAPGAGVVANKFPVPEGASEVRSEAGGEMIFFQSDMSVTKIAEYYRKELGRLGWKENEEETLLDEEFHVGGITFAKGDESVRVAIQDGRPEFRTRTIILSEDLIRLPRDLGDKTSPDVAGLAEAMPAEGLAEKPAGDDSMEPARDTRRLLATQVPVPEGAIGLHRDAELEMVIYESKADPNAIAEFYRKKLAELGWQEDKEESFVDDEVGSLVFAKGDEAFQVSILDARPENRTRMIIQGEGLVWPGREEDTDAAVAVDGPEMADKSEEPAAVDDARGDAKAGGQGTLWLDDTTYKLDNAVAYQTKMFDETVTVVLLIDKPVSMTNLRNALKQDEDFFVFGPQVKLHFDRSGELTYLFIWVDNNSINESFSGDRDEVEVEARISGARARGKAVMKEPKEFFDHTYRFDVTFDLDVLKAGKQSPKPAGEGELVAKDHDGLPAPWDATELVIGGSPFRRSIQGKVRADLKEVIEFYRRELGERGWKENADQAVIEGERAELSFQGEEGLLSLELRRKRKDTVIELATRDPRKAKEAGIAPPAGKTRLLLGNTHDKDAVIVVDGKEHNIAAGVGADDPLKAPKLDLDPGKHTVQIKVPGEEAQTEELDMGKDQTWGVIVIPTGGYFADQIY